MVLSRPEPAHCVLTGVLAERPSSSFAGGCGCQMLSRDRQLFASPAALIRVPVHGVRQKRIGVDPLQDLH